MKYVRFKANNIEKYGVLENDLITEISNSYFEDYTLTDKNYMLSDVTLLPPSNASKVVAVGLNYLSHINEFSGRDVPKNPVIFVKLPHTIIATEEAIIIPENATRVDYEAELAIVIKKYCKKVKQEDVHHYILGATCLNDVTERDVQRSDGQWIRGKNYETFCPIGPIIVDNIDYNNLAIQSVLNGEVKQNSSTNHFIWKVEELISFISDVIPLHPGDVVTTGTPEGVGPLKSGDVIEVVVEGIGTLKNIVK